MRHRFCDTLDSIVGVCVKIALGMWAMLYGNLECWCLIIKYAAAQMSHLRINMMNQFVQEVYEFYFVTIYLWYIIIMSPILCSLFHRKLKNSDALRPWDSNWRCPRRTKNPNPQLPEPSGLPTLFTWLEMTLHDSAALRQGPYCRVLRGLRFRRGFAACPPAIPPIRIWLPPFKRIAESQEIKAESQIKEEDPSFIGLKVKPFFGAQGGTMKPSRSFKTSKFYHLL